MNILKSYMISKIYNILDYFCLPIILLAAALLRLPYLTERSLWYDEAASWQTAKFPLGEMLQSVRLNVHVPLYYLLLKGWMAAWGESVASLRGFSIVFGVLTVYAANLFGRELYRASAISVAKDASSAVEVDRKARGFGLVLAGLVAVSAYQVYASIECKMYSLTTALSVLSAWLLLRILRDPRPRTLWFCYGASCLSLLYLHHYALFMLAAHVIFWVSYLAFQAAHGGWAQSRDLLVPWAAVSAVVTLGYLPGMAILRGQVGRVRGDYWIGPLSWDSFFSTFANFVRPSPDVELLPYGEFVAEIVVIAAVIVAARGRRGDYLVITLSLLPMAFAAMASMITPVWVPRYFRMVHPFLLSLVALAAWRVPRIRPTLFAAGFAVLLASDVVFWKLLDIPGGPGVRGAVESALAGRLGDEMIVATDFMQYFPAKYYTKQRARIRLLDAPDNPFWGEQLVRPSDRITRKGLATELRRGVWVICKGSDLTLVVGTDKVKILYSRVFRYYNNIHDNLRVVHCILDTDLDSQNSASDPVEIDLPPR